MNFPRINVKNLLFLPNGRDYAEEMYGVGTDAIGFSRQNRRCAYTMWVHPEIATTGQKTWNRGVQKQAGITAVNFYLLRKCWCSSKEVIGLACLEGEAQHNCNRSIYLCDIFCSRHI
ncbi:uncharacterized protein LOC118743480 isoform X2 [Rhagoletis pomonella]|uniref:uncharacterized protein LOC118743480 isoform X2 n=1 Tax=Rhagoletis pomonella TaxID=28610 RepID=UPI00177B5027|nr:uncharacterized protein LOC118743480 isoform X2 [Rhagoletis pomonella]